ncbi:MAG TPA: acyl-CoA dehydrogenase family protein [Candidatus Dormibacteraeota bacterium]|jgi:glutaryl-CoA dehydrogenase|nr:acyl-CoA dehydrogenase family protein [Candidatus Dormibacteraeota bacterium]
MATTHPAPRRTTPPPASDLYGVDDLLGADERLIRDTVRSFVREQALPLIGEHFEAGTFPRELIPRVAELGLLGMHLDGYGCAGASAMAYGVACEELEAGDSGLRSFVSVQGSLAMFPIHAYGSEEQKTRWLPEMASGRAIGCFGLTEPDAGSDPAAMRTTAQRSGSDWVLRGSKMWITNGSIADVAVVWARTDDDIRGFLVERGTPGFSARDIERKLSLRASVTSELTFDDVRLPAGGILPGVAGLRGPLSCLSEARYGISWGALGAGRACFEAAVDYAGTRTMFGKPLSAFQLTQQKLADMATALVQGRLVAHRLGTLKDAGAVHPVQVSLAKRANVRIALDIARSARTILGANGVTLEYPVARHMANLESVLTYEGTEEVHTLILGKAITGVDAFA